MSQSLKASSTRDSEQMIESQQLSKSAEKAFRGPPTDWQRHAGELLG